MTIPSHAALLVEPSLHIASGGASPQVALTLDACTGAADGRILDELVADHVPATIFVTGRWLRHNPAGPLWEIEARQAGQTAFAEYGSERAARRVLNRMLAGDATGWRQLPR